MATRPRLVLTVLDGFGLSPATIGNAISQARTPNLDSLLAHFPWLTLTAHGTEVGLSWGEMGNSEVGHLNIGAGRIVVQDVTRIGQAIDDGSFFHTPALVTAARRAKEHNRTLHLIGIASAGGVHGHVRTLAALLKLAHDQGVSQVALHLIADGRDTEPTSLGQYLPLIEKARVQYGGQYATLMGRYYAMDRDRHWDRTRAAYQALMNGAGPSASTIEAAIESAYRHQLSDEFILPTVIAPTHTELRIQPGDTVIFTNHRPDRARQLARALAGTDFDDFTRTRTVEWLTTFTNYGVSLKQADVAFATDPVSKPLADVLDAANVRQFHVAETEKYAHVTYFFNGYIEEPFGNERRQLIQSPKVATYDLAPAMAAAKVTDAVLDGYTAGSFDVAIANYANADMVGHTGNLSKTIQAIEVIDAELGRLSQRILQSEDVLLVTADHGNAEQLIHPETGDIDKEHTTNPVPLLVVGRLYQHRAMDPDSAKQRLMGTQPVGILADVAPTILELLGLDQPAAMTGQSLLENLRHLD
ncbi:2,3-bisphosphoglycerate-independent phosphoglycerate mutase [Candidatus Berkelbacteria bacterium]|nr:2,3-bisphosphoglycerate-independent phosphoglycerate mutase [Candidatus Berkelbacteria bacterium]